MPYGVALLDEAGRLLFANPAFEALGGGDGAPAPDDPELRRLRDGRWMRVRRVPLGEGRTMLLIADATLERLRVEQAEHSATMLDRVVEAMPAAIAIKDRKGRYVKINRRFAELFGRPAHEILGRTADVFLDGTTVEAAVSADRAAAETGEDQPATELTIARKDGGPPSVVLVSKRPLRAPGGTVDHVLTVGLDITAHRAAEEARSRLADLVTAALENIPSGIAILDADGVLALCNTAYAEIAGRPPETLRGVPVEELLRMLHGALSPEVRQAAPRDRWVADRLAATMRADGAAHEMALADGRWFLVSVRPLAEGRRVVVRTEITQVRHAQAQAEAAREAAERANRAKSQFLMNMSHELRTPLNAVIGFAEVIRDELAGPLGTRKYAEYARDIHASGMHLLSVIGDLLDMSKIDVGRYDIEDEVFDLRELAWAALAMMRTQADAGGVALEMAGADGEGRMLAPGPRVRADRRAVMQILLNLLGNAVKFTPAGGRVTVAVARTADGGVRFSVEDTGIGIPEPAQPRLFEPFQMGDASVARSKGGSGLGLWISRSLAQLHGGAIALESAPGRGTAVAVTLPPERVVG
jgi:two-component system cell cycle sensor histidine kinase PleC